MRRITFTKWAGALGLIAALVLPSDGALAQRAPAPPPGGAPSCGGGDMIAEMATRDTAAHQRVQAASATMRNGRGIFWKIEKPGVPASYLFGTVHLTDDRVNALPPPVVTALEGASTVALEIDDLSPAKVGQAMGKLQSLLVFTDGRTLDKLLAPDEIAIAQKALESSGIPSFAVSTLRPWFVAMSLALTDCERQRTAAGLKALDQRLGDRARARKIPVVGLETVEEQLKALAGLPESHQVALLKAGLKSHHRLADQIETLVRRYLASDLGAIWAFQKELWQAHGAPEAAGQAFRQVLLAKRNHKMRDGALPLLAKGRAFIAVGALHLPGDDGLVALFQAAGYTATVVK